MLDAFYGAFSPACLAVLGLWLVVVQLRLPQWQASEAAPLYQRASYGIALQFALPGLMSLLALAGSGDPAYWRTSFAIIALGGAVVLIALRGLFGRSGSGRGADPAAGPRLGGGLGLAAYVLAIAAYLVVAVLAFIGGSAALHAEAILLTGLVFLGFNAAWLLLFDSVPDSRPTAPARSTAPTAAESAADSADIDATPTATGWAPDSRPD